MTVVKQVDLAGVCTGDGPCDTSPVGTGKNWITKADPVTGLGDYGRAIVHALIAKGHSKSDAVRLMWGVLRDWASGKGNVTAATRARAAKELAHLKTLQAASHSHSRGGGMAIDLSGSVAQLLPDADAVRKAAAHLMRLPEALRGPAKARILARAKALGITVDLAIPQAQRDKAKAAGLTFPGSTSYPLAGPDGKFSRALADKAVKMVQLGNVASSAAIRKWLMGKLRSNGASDLIPSNWNADGSIGGAS